MLTGISYAQISLSYCHSVTQGTIRWRQQMIHPWCQYAMCLPVCMHVHWPQYGGSTGDILSCVSWGVSKGARPKCDCILLSCASSVAERTYFSEFAISFCPATVTSISFSRCRVVLLHYAFLWRGRADPCFWSRWLMWARTKLFFSRVDCICEGLSLLTAWFLRGWYSLLIQCITCGWVWWTVSTRGSLIFRSLFSKWAVVGLEYTLWFASLLCITRLLRFPLHGKGKSSAIKM